MADATILLAAALKAQDAVAVALALRNGLVIVPAVDDDPPQVRVFPRRYSDSFLLLLFSSLETYEAMLPDEVERPFLAYDAAALREYLLENASGLESVWFDVAGPYAMQAAPQDVLDALQLDAN